MLNEKILKSLNEQINKELYSSYLYLSIANYYSDKNLDGFCNWFEVQAKEEMDHAMLFRKYILNNDCLVLLDGISKPITNYNKMDEALTVSLEHEKMITASICEIYSLALECKDYKTTQFLDWFVKEQGEEEKNSTDLINKFNLFGADSKSLYLLNTELLARVYIAPTLVL